MQNLQLSISAFAQKKTIVMKSKHCTYQELYGFLFIDQVWVKVVVNKSVPFFPQCIQLIFGSRGRALPIALSAVVFGSARRWARRSPARGRRGRRFLSGRLSGEGLDQSLGRRVDILSANRPSDE